MIIYENIKINMEGVRVVDLVIEIDVILVMLFYYYIMFLCFILILFMYMGVLIVFLIEIFFVSFLKVL